MILFFFTHYTISHLSPAARNLINRPASAVMAITEMAFRACASIASNIAKLPGLMTAKRTGPPNSAPGGPCFIEA
jgi:hypothetical protein